MRWKPAVSLLASIGLFGIFQGGAVGLASAGTTLVIGVDHVDQANQNFAAGRVFGYNDFFSRAVTVHAGDTLDFKTAFGFHILSVTTDVAAARAAIPLALPDTDDPNAVGSGAPKIMAGPAFFAANGPPACGTSVLTPCGFNGGTLPPAGVIGGNDWFVNVKASPGTYQYFCFLHPGMQGTLSVVDSAQPTTGQAVIDAQSAGEFASDQSQALDVEAAASIPTYTGGAPGTRTYQVNVGITAAKNHVALLEMLPSKLDLSPGDSVRYVWGAVEGHSVTFPASFDVPPFGPDFEPPDPADTGFEIVADPGNAPSGTALSSPVTPVDSGILLGSAYGLRPSVQTWSVGTAATTASGAYTYHCVLHDWMRGRLNVVSP
jgi:plastocyanin